MGMEGRRYRWRWEEAVERTDVGKWRDGWMDWGTLMVEGGRAKYEGGRWKELAYCVMG